MAYGWPKRLWSNRSTWKNEHFRSTFARIEASQWWSRSELEELQLESVRRLIAHAYEQTGFYRERLDGLGLRPDDFRALGDLVKLPLLTKADVRENAERMLAGNADRGRLFLNTTGGSTDVPLSLYQDRLTRDPHENAYRLRQWRWGGYRFGDRFANFQGNLIPPRGAAGHRP